MAEPAKAQPPPPIDAHLLDKFLEAEAPDLESSDERLGKVNDLVTRGEYLDGARAAEALLREGLFDVRLVGAYLLGLFLEQGLAAMPVMFHSLSCTLLRNWQFFGPRERKDVHADASLRWLLKMLNKHLEHHERMKDETWQRWSRPAIRESLEQALALSEEIFSALGSAMPRNGCEASFRRLTQWLEGHLASLPAPAAPEAADPGEAEGEKAEPAEAEPRAAEPRRASAPEDGPTVPVSAPLAHLMRKLAAFEKLVEGQDFQRATVVAADVLQVVEHFDPRVYLPAIFSRFFAALSTHAEQVEPLLGNTESLGFRALDQLYRVDLDTFLAQSTESGGAEE